MAENIRIGFIGFGSMGQAICDGLIRTGTVPPACICASGRNQEKLRDNTQKRGIAACESTAAVVSASDIVLLCVKPNQVKEALSPEALGVDAEAPGAAERAAEILSDKALISIVSGFDYDACQKFLPAEYHHLSTIPNTPVASGQGVFVCEQKHSLTEEQLAAFKDVFSQIAILEFLPTELMGPAEVIAGCAPAYAAMMIEALGDAGVKFGLSRDTAYRLAAQMMAGTGALAVQTGQHPAAMKDAVCTPGGSTIVGVQSLERSGFRSALIEAVDAVMHR